MVDEPDWSFLPDHPDRFFGIDAGSSREDLKRRYGALIRRYKPERFPEEFKRIRSAYEQVDAWLCGVGEERAESERRAQWDESLATARPAHGADAVAHNDIDGADSLPSTLTEWRAALAAPDCDLSAFRRRLADTRRKSPLHYYVLAVLADLDPDSEDNAFYTRILDGLREFPTEPGLLRVLYAELEQESPQYWDGKVHAALADVLPADAYYSVAGDGLLAILRTSGFEAFRQQLAESDRRLRGDGLFPRAALLMRALRESMLTADLEWLRAQMALMEEKLPRLGPHFEHSYDVLQFLLRYRIARSQFLSSHGHPLRHRIDVAIRHYCEGPVETAHHELLCVYSEMFAAPEELAAAFPVSALADVEAVYAVLQFFVELHAPRVPDGEAQLNAPLAPLAIRFWLGHIEQRTDNRRWLAFKKSLNGFRVLCAMAIVYLAPPALSVGVATVYFGKLSADRELAIFVGVLFGWGLLVRYRLARVTFAPYAQRLARSWSLRAYERVWRAEVFKFLKWSRIPVWRVEQCIAEVQDDTLNQEGWLHECMIRDYAISFYSLAARLAL
ncbi:MAG: hypothetical protein ACKVX7_09975 [Planctomycetota bacterium]